MDIGGSVDIVGTAVLDASLGLSAVTGDHIDPVFCL
jgi:hypothetical protein